MKSLRKISLLVSLFLIFSTAASIARHKDPSLSGDYTTTVTPPLADLKCPKCQNPMEIGYLLEDQGYTLGLTDTKWVQGPVPEKHPSVKQIKVQRRVQSYRCTSCGYLEQYAR